MKPSRLTVERAERSLRALGFTDLRVRHGDDTVARRVDAARHRKVEVLPGGESKQWNFVNGRASTSVGYRYVLLPRETGEFVVGPATVKIDVERADEWIGKGAHPSDTVRSLLDRARSAQG